MSTSRDRKSVATLGRSSNGMRMTPEEFDAASPWDGRYSYELIRGVLIVNPPPDESERDPNGELEYLLRLHRDANPHGPVLDATLSEQYVAYAENRRRADRVIWIGSGRVPNPEVDVPTIVIELVSRRNRDRRRDYEEKRREYLALGITEYWVIDRFARTMTVFRRPPQEPTMQVVGADATYETPLLPGFQLPLSRLWTLSDRWKKGPRRQE